MSYYISKRFIFVGVFLLGYSIGSGEYWINIVSIPLIGFGRWLEKGD